MEDDRIYGDATLKDYHFNPRPPHGGRPLNTYNKGDIKNISTHVLRMEDDSKRLSALRKNKDFNPRPPHGGRRGPLIST